MEHGVSTCPARPSRQRLAAASRFAESSKHCRDLRLRGRGARRRHYVGDVGAAMAASNGRYCGCASERHHRRRHGVVRADIWPVAGRRAFFLSAPGRSGIRNGSSRRRNIAGRDTDGLCGGQPAVHPLDLGARAAASCGHGTSTAFGESGVLARRGIHRFLVLGRPGAEANSGERRHSRDDLCCRCPVRRELER